MNGKLMLYRDQYGSIICARNLRALQTAAGGGRISKMYAGKGYTKHIGYIIGSRWFTAYTPFESIE